ncbi:MAG: tetratricopeptide repeat protein, partial [Candidatus Omnitrophota bacterium]
MINERGYMSQLVIPIVCDAVIAAVFIYLGLGPEKLWKKVISTQGDISWGRLSYNLALLGLLIISIVITISIQMKSAQQQQRQEEIQRATLQKVNEVLAGQQGNKITDNEISSLIYEKTGFTLMEVKQMANDFKERTKSYLDIGLANYILGNYKEAIADYNKAIEINPKLAEAYMNRGVAYGQQNNL